MDNIELYKCEFCKEEFKVTGKERLTTFILHEPDTWPCPKCGSLCFCNAKYSTSEGGKF